MDKKGFYRILGVKETATPKEIKLAFRQQVKLYHPDKNTIPEATEKYLKINEAYHVLIDEDARKAYDNHSEVSSEFQPCCCCGVHSKQPRFVLFDEMTTLKGGVYCPSCASKQQFKSSMKNWRAFFFSPLKVLRALKNLYRFSHLPEQKNFEMLMQNARAFRQEKRISLARFLAMQAKQFAKETADRNKIESFLNALPVTPNLKENNAWKITWKDALRVYFPVFLLLIVLSVSVITPLFHHFISPLPTVIVDYQQPEIIPFKFDLNDETLLYHTAERIKAYQAPTEKSGVLALLPEQTTVRITGHLPKTKWVQAMTAEGLLVYLLTPSLQKGRGKNPLPYSSKITLPE